jgi:hypothetical protein
MAKANHTLPAIPKPLGYSEAFNLLDAVEQAKSRLKGTVGLMAVVIDSGREYDEGVVLTLERHLSSDVAALDEACGAAWEAILSPLHAIAYPGVTPFGKAGGQ